MCAWSLDDIPSQSGRVAIVTGANAGIGYETARVLAMKGARVVLACRSAEKGNAAVARIAAEGISGAEFAALDLADLDSVQRFADHFSRDNPRLDLLINNAGVMVPPKSATKQGFELQFGTNHLGHFALSARLYPLLRAAQGSRVVVVSSSVHHMGRITFDDLHFERRRYNDWAAYSQSKLANLLFALELNRRVRAKGVGPLVTAAHPGWTATDLQRTAPLVRAFGPWLAMKPLGGALPTLRAAVDPTASGGDYYGPQQLFELRGPPGRARINRKARDEAVAAQLWQVSEALTGVHFDLAHDASTSA
jgi:NAD(P)-dependent dehydrogenase (short-subunit alcohol dehydrogenase family)